MSDHPDWRAVLAARKRDMMPAGIHEIIAKHAIPAEGGNTVARCHLPLPDRPAREKVCYPTLEAAQACADEMHAAGNNRQRAYQCKKDGSHFHTTALAT